MKYIVENWDTEEIIAVFDTEEQRELWLLNYSTEGYLADGTKISIYEQLNYKKRR